MIRTIKTKQFKITAFVLALVLTVSCVLWNTTKVHAQELTIDNTNVQTFAGARAITNDKLVGTADNPATMSVFVTDGSSNKYNANNMRWIHKGDGWQSSEAASVFFAGPNSIQKIYALSPYEESATDGIVTITADGKTDWLVATRTELITNAASLQMTHALSKLVIKPTFGTEVTNQTITSIEVKDMYASGTLKISDNTWSRLGATTNLKMENKELLVIPMEDCSSFEVVITMEDSRVFTTTVSLAGVDSKLAAGTQYNITLQVGQDRVTLGGITAEDWKSADGGNLETE